MKKFFTITLLTLVTAMALSSCTEETITPTTQHDNGGGGGMEDPKR